MRFSGLKKLFASLLSLGGREGHASFRESGAAEDQNSAERVSLSESEDSAAASPSRGGHEGGGVVVLRRPSSRRSISRRRLSIGCSRRSAASSFLRTACLASSAENSPKALAASETALKAEAERCADGVEGTAAAKASLTFGKREIGNREEPRSSRDPPGLSTETTCEPRSEHFLRKLTAQFEFSLAERRLRTCQFSFQPRGVRAAKEDNRSHRQESLESLGRVFS